MKVIYTEVYTIHNEVSHSLITKKFMSFTIVLKYIRYTPQSLAKHCLRFFYKPQRSCGQGYVFTCVCDSVHRRGVCLSACWDTTPPEQTPPPPEQTPPGSRHHHPQGRHPHPPRSRPPTPGIRSMNGRYASYWNAFLFEL